MNIVKRIDQYNEKYVYFCDSIKNNVMNEGNFIRILYSMNQFSLNGIYLLFELNDVYVEKYYNKYKCSFQIYSHKEVFDQLNKIEENLLKKISLKHKIPQYKITEQLRNGHIKIFSDKPLKENSNKYMLKISGIWETELHYGVTYKFMMV
jgi:hypothetical protein